ncbi:MAG: hypothetical protein U0U67_03005 [Chitinophagales bacterium]
MKWFLHIVFLTIYFIVISFFLDVDLRFSFRFMSMAMALVSFIYFLIVFISEKKEVKKSIGGNLAAIVIKFMLSAMIIVVYSYKYGMHYLHEFLYFFIAYGSFSVLSFWNGYWYKPRKK